MTEEKQRNVIRARCAGLAAVQQILQRGKSEQRLELSPCPRDCNRPENLLQRSFRFDLFLGFGFGQRFVHGPNLIQARGQ